MPREYNSYEEQCNKERMHDFSAMVGTNAGKISNIIDFFNDFANANSAKSNDNIDYKLNSLQSHIVSLIEDIKKIRRILEINGLHDYK